MVVAWASARVVTQESRRAMSPLRRVFGVCRGYVCDSGLKGRFPIAQSAALGEELAAVTTNHALIKKWPTARQHPNPPLTHPQFGQRP